MQYQMNFPDTEKQRAASSFPSKSSSTAETTKTSYSSSLVSVSNNVIAGCFAGAGARMAVAPLDLIRIRLQLDPQTSLWHLVQNVRKESGWKGFFRGNVPATYLWVGYSAVQFAVYARLSEALQQQQHFIIHHKSIIAFVSGASAGVAATIVTYPLDICRTNFAAAAAPSVSSTTPRPTTMLEFAHAMLKRQGIRGFWAGVVPGLYGIIPYMGFNFLIFEALVGERTASNAGMAGAISGASSKLLVYPLDTIKKRLQVQAYASNQIRYQGTVDCLVQIVRCEGFGSLYRGIAPSMLKNTIATSLSFSLYILAQDVLHSITGRLCNSP